MKTTCLLIGALLSSLLLWSGLADAGTATFTWNKNTEVDLAGYKVYMRKEGAAYGAPMSTIADKNASTAIVNVPDEPLAHKKYFVLTAYDLAGNESPFSNEVSKVFAGTEPVHPPMVKPVFTTTAQTETSITIAWASGPDGMGGVAHVDIRYAVAPISWGAATSATCTVSPCTITGLTPGVLHNVQGVFYRGVLNQGAVFGPISDVLAVSTKDTAPHPPAGLTITKATPEEVIIVAKLMDCPGGISTSTKGSTAAQPMRTVRCKP